MKIKSFKHGRLIACLQLYGIKNIFKTLFRSFELKKKKKKTKKTKTKTKTQISKPKC